MGGCEMEIEEFSMYIILHAGDAKSLMYEALQNARNGAFEQTESKMNQASLELLKAHKFQTKFIHEDAKFNLERLPVLLIHAQDHLMTVMAEKNLIKELIMMYRKQHQLEEKIELVVEKIGGL